MESFGEDVERFEQWSSGFDRISTDECSTGALSGKIAELKEVKQFCVG